MDAPLVGYLYFDLELFGGHYFIVGPDDPIDNNNVIIFCCTSQSHERPDSLGCHSNHEFPSYHISTGTINAFTKPTWIQLDAVYYKEKREFVGHWSHAREKLDFKLTIDLLKCASQSSAIAGDDKNACLEVVQMLSNAQ